MSQRRGQPAQAPASRVQLAAISITEALQRSAVLRWTALVVVALVAWLLIFWLVNLPADTATTPGVAVVQNDAA